MNVGFIRIFWGLLLVVLDIRFNSVDLIVPDFVGYILIVSGLTLLVPYHQWFRRARILAMVMIFVSLGTLVDVKIDSTQLSRVKREWLALLTGDLDDLLPQHVASARLVHVTNSGTEIDSNRTHNPQRDKDRVLGKYSDGTVVLILRYDSADEAHQAMKQKNETEYSFDGIRQRATTDASFRADNISAQHGSIGGEQIYSEYSNLSAADRVIQQWWTRGPSWWNPASWRSWHSDGLLFVVEGYDSSANAYKLAFEDKNHNRTGITVDALFPISIVGELLNTLLIWAICSGVIAMALASNNYALMVMAKTRRALYLAFAVPGFAISIISFVVPEALAPMLSSGGMLLMVIYAVLAIASVVLIMGLMRKAANSLPPPNPV